MKVTIIKGPHFEERQKKAYEMLYHIISKKAAEEKNEIQNLKKEVI